METGGPEAELLRLLTWGTAGHWLCAANRTHFLARPDAVLRSGGPALRLEIFRVYFKLQDKAAQSIAMLVQLAGGPNLIAPVLAKYCGDEKFFEFPQRFGVQDAPAIHLQYESPQLILHRLSPWQGIAGKRWEQN